MSAREARTTRSRVEHVTANVVRDILRAAGRDYAAEITTIDQAIARAPSQRAHEHRDGGGGG